MLLLNLRFRVTSLPTSLNKRDDCGRPHHNDENNINKQSYQGRDICGSLWCKEYTPFARRIYQHTGSLGKKATAACPATTLVTSPP